MDILTVDIEEQFAVLRKRSEPVKNIDQALVDYTQMMFDEIENSGIGLAAPQVGRNERFFVVKLGPNEKPFVFINPEIIGTSEELSSYEEGCLSIPGVYADIKRPAAIEVQAWNLKGRPFKMEMDGLLATCFQHEFDHLEGKMFYDYLSPRKQDKLMKKYLKSVG